MSDTKFFVELAADEYGNTSMQRAVVEAVLTEENGRDLLVPVAPQHFVDGWPTGWYRDSFGGWAEVDGPARMLSHDEYSTLISSLSEEAKAGAQSGLVILRTGEKLPRIVVQATMPVLRSLMGSSVIAFYEAVMIARDSKHEPFAGVGEELQRYEILDGNGNMHDLMRSVILAATEGELLELRLVDPIVNKA